MIFLRSYALLSVVVLFGLLNNRAQAEDKALQQLFAAHCVDCHGPKTQEASLRLDDLKPDFGTAKSFALWVKIHDKLDKGEMPPKESPQPSVEERRGVVSWLTKQLTVADTARQKAEGRAVFRRLNRTEYENTLRDLFSLQGLEVKDLLPEDGRTNGFDKSAAGLDLSYVQLAKYMEAADVALDAAIAPHAERPALFKVHIPGAGCHTLFAHTFLGQTVFLKDFKYDDSLLPIPTERINKDAEAAALRRKNQKNPYDGTIGVLVPEGVGEFKPRFPFRALVAGRYIVRMSVWSFVWDKGEVKPNSRTESALLSAEGRTLGYFDAPSLKPLVTEIEVWLNPMKSPKDEILFNAASLWPAGPNNGNVANYVGPGIAVDWLEIEGPLLDGWPSAGHRRLFGDLPLVDLPETRR